MSFKDKNHLVSNISWLQGSHEPSPEEMGSQNLEEVEVSSFRETLQAYQSSSPKILPVDPVNESSLMTESDILRLRKYYKILSQFQLHTPGPGDRVISGT